MNESIETIGSPHDKFFKSMFSRVDVTRDSLWHFLSGPIFASLNLGTLLLRPGTFVDPRLKQQSTDLLFSVEFQGSPLFLYLMWEHKSYVDRGICFQLLGCKDRIWADCRKRGEDCPPILPIVLYHGKKPWTAPRRLMDSLRMPDAMRVLLAPLHTDLGYVLADLSKVNWEDFRQNAALALSIGLMKAWAEDNLEEWLRRSWPVWGELIRQERRGDRAGQVRTLLVYLFEAARGEMNYAKMKTLIETAEPEVKERAMSIAEELIEKGEQRGIQKGLEQGIAQGLEKGALIGQIQAYQETLQQPVSGAEQLRDKTMAELNEHLARLKEAIQTRPS